MEDAMSIGLRTPEEKEYAGKIMTVMEQVKDANKDLDGIRSHVVGHVHIEDYALKLFAYAEQNDSQSIFDQKMMRAFYTSGYLFDLLTSKTLLNATDEPNETLLNNKKYAHWRASYIFNCFRNKETPISASINRHQQEQNDDNPTVEINKKPNNELNEWGLPQVPSAASQSPSNYGFNAYSREQVPKSSGDVSTVPRNSTSLPPSQFQQFDGASGGDIRAPFQSPPSVPAVSRPAIPASSNTIPSSSTGHVITTEQAAAFDAAKGLTIVDYAEARKYAKFALSAMDFEDAGTAIQNFQRAISVLQRGPK